MRAMVFKGVGQPLSLESVADPTPADEEVVLRVGRCGICGTDLHRTEENLITYREGTVPGHEFSGEVVAVGRGVDHLKVGDAVTSLPYIGCNRCAFCLRGSPAFCSNVRNVGTEKHTGAFAEYVAVGAPFTLKLPAALSLADGALIEPLAVALRGVLRAQVQPGSKVLVLGAGPIGLATAFWAKRAGAAKVAIQASSDRRADIAHDMGADLFVRTAEGDTPARSARRAMGGAPDVVFECVGLPGLIDQAIATVRPQGMVVVLGACAEHDTWMPVVGVSKEIDIRFSYVYDVREYQTAIDTLDAGHVSPRAMITDTVSMEGMADAFEGLRRRSPQCKVLLAPWGT